MFYKKCVGSMYSVMTVTCGKHYNETPMTVKGLMRFSVRTVMTILWRMKFIRIIFKDLLSHRNSFQLMLFGGIIAVYCENLMKHINTICGQNVEVVCIVCICVLKGTFIWFHDFQFTKCGYKVLTMLSCIWGSETESTWI